MFDLFPLDYLIVLINMQSTLYVQVSAVGENGDCNALSVRRIRILGCEYKVKQSFGNNLHCVHVDM